MWVSVMVDVSKWWESVSKLWDNVSTVSKWVPVNGGTV